MGQFVRDRGVFAALVVMLVASSTVVAMAPATAVTSPNPVVVENQQPGSTGWQIPAAGYQVGDDSSGQVKGYASATSVNKGDSIAFNISVNPPQAVTLTVYRLGWYGGSGGRLVTTLGPFDGITQPPCPEDVTTGLIECHWSSTTTLTVPDTWTSGIFVGVLSTADKFQNYVLFTVRDDSRPADLLVQQSVTTYQAYSGYPNDGHTGKSLYNGYGPSTVAGARAVKVSFDRPYANRGDGDLFSWEVNFIRWLEHAGYDAVYATDVDTHANGNRLLNYKAFVSMGHDEYWSKQMRDAVEATRDAGRSLAFFGANDVNRQIRFEASTTGVPNRVIVAYKNATLDPVKGADASINWRDTGRPEQTLLGIQYSALENAYTSYVAENSSDWVYANTGFADGNSVPKIEGYETDGYMSNYPGPVALAQTLLSQSPVTSASNGPTIANSSIYQAPSGGWVFDAGTIGWSWGLDDYGTTGTSDARIQQTTANILDFFVSGSHPPPPTTTSTTSTTTTTTTTTSTTTTTTTTTTTSTTSTTTVPATTSTTSTTTTTAPPTTTTTPQPPPTTVPQGNGLGAFGSQGSVFFGWDGAGDLVWLPPGVNLTVDRGSRATWSANTSDVRALQAPGSDSRKAAALYDGSFIQLHLEFASGWTGYLHLYGVDWDSTARRQTIIVDDSKRQLSVPLDSSFNQGTWTTVPVDLAGPGTLIVTVTRQGGANAVLSGLFLERSPTGVRGGSVDITPRYGHM